MKKTLKKGFTLVELVIVIAVIAILSAVLIPTFGNVISNAKKSSAQSEASNAVSQYITNAASNGQSADLADGYVLVFEKKQKLVDFSTETGTVNKGTVTTNYAASNVAYVFAFKGGRLEEVASGVTAEKVITNTVTDTTLYQLIAGTEQDATSTQTVAAKGKTVSTYGVYFLDAEITESGENATGINAKIVLLCNK